jgi:protocatechuate 3,4-dioxygenase beta subunit
LKIYQRIICLAMVFLAMIFAVSGFASAQNGECPDCSDVAQCNETPCVRDLIAGQHYDSGDVVVWNNESHLFVMYDTTDDWCLEETQVHVATSLDNVPKTGNGNPIPGNFDYKNETHGCADNYTYEIPLSDISLNDCDTVYILTHANVSRLNPAENEDPDETAWGEGEDFGGPRWAYYFCYTIAPTASIGDFVWNDLNENSIQDDGEPGITGVLVNLYNCSDDSLIATTTTNENGYYNFTNLAPGEYYVNFITPPEFEFISHDQGADDTLDSDANNITGNTSCITLTSGENNDTIDAGLYEIELPEDKAAIGDRLWEDLNGNGIQDGGELGIQGLTVELYNCSDDILVSSTTTDANGYYNFTVEPGEYYVKFSSDGYEFTLQDQGADDTADSDANSSGITDCVTLASNETNYTVDAGLYQPASIGDYVWEDVNGDGIQNDGDTGIDNVTVNLYNCNGDLLETTKTNQTGYYNFTGLAPGEYYLGFTAPSGYEFTTLGDGEYFEDSDANPSGNTSCVALTSGETDNSIDAGLYQPASIGDFVWNDTNVNGTQDNGEPGVTGVLVKLYDCDTGVEIANTTTNGTGYYNFTNLEPGDYYVNFTAPPGFEFTLQDQEDDTLDSDANNTTGNTTCITLSSGEYNNTLDAGIFEPSPEIDIEKYTNGQDADDPSGPVIQIGSQVKWTYNVTNTGNVNLTNVAVTDTKIGNICTIATLNESESVTCSATGTAKTGQYSNYGNVTAMYEGIQVNDSDPSHYFGYDHWAGVPTANPMLLVGVLGIAMLLFIRREQNKK